MEYPFKLSEIIAGCESGAWLEGAVFKSDSHNFIYFENKQFKNIDISRITDTWRFDYYKEDL